MNMAVPPDSLHISIDHLIQVVQRGGKVRTGIDIFSKNGVLLLEKNALVEKDSILFKVKQLGVTRVPISEEHAGGIWDGKGNPVTLAPAPSPDRTADDRQALQKSASSIAVAEKLHEIAELKRAAAKKYRLAQKNIREVIQQIINNGGEFDVVSVQRTVHDLFAFTTCHNNAFSYLTREILAYDDYLYSHAVNVCTIGTAILHNFNDHFSSTVNRQLGLLRPEHGGTSKPQGDNSFTYYFPEELQDIAMGFFLHDIGKTLIDRSLLFKKGRLTESEFETTKLHSLEKGLELLEKNKLHNSYLANISRYHHAALYDSEPRCYPEERAPIDLPPYVKICKLADVYDAMTSRRSYGQAGNPVTAVADIFHKYAEKDQLLQIILHSFVRTIGIYPPGSSVWLTNGQLVYIIDGKGPIVMPLTNSSGIPLTERVTPVDLSESGDGVPEMVIDKSRKPPSPMETFQLLPEKLQESLYLHPVSA